MSDVGESVTFLQSAEELSEDTLCENQLLSAAKNYKGSGIGGEKPSISCRLVARTKTVATRSSFILPSTVRP